MRIRDRQRFTAPTPAAPAAPTPAAPAAPDAAVPAATTARADNTAAQDARLQAAAQALGLARHVAPSPRSARAARSAVVALRADLNRSVFDGSPLRVTPGEVRHAHDTLMQLEPAAFSAALDALPPAMLNRYVAGLADAVPFSLDTNRDAGLAQLAQRLATETEPAVARAVVGALDETARGRLVEGLLQLPSGAHIEAMRDAVGDDAFAALVQGNKADSLIGDGLVAGRVYEKNVTGGFKTAYAAALDGTLPIPEAAKDTTFMMGPGLFGDQLPGYLEPNARALTEWGVPSENIHKLKYNTASSPADNAKAIRDQILAQHVPGKKLVVMGHSKFGRDMLEAFARYPELKDIVSGSVLMQPALSAQIAQDLGKNGPQAKLLEPMLQLVGGNRGAFDGLSDSLHDLPKWPGDDVPTVVMASTTESPKALLHALNHPYYKGVYGASSDGAVSFQNQASIDGAHMVTLPGMADHAQPGLVFADVTEHFAVQIEAGAPDAVVRGMLDRLDGMVPMPGALDMVKNAWIAHHDTPEERANCVRMLRAAGPMLDRMARVANRNVGHPLVDNAAMTQALTAQLFSEVAP